MVVTLESQCDGLLQLLQLLGEGEIALRCNTWTRHGARDIEINADYDWVVLL